MAAQWMKDELKETLHAALGEKPDVNVLWALTRLSKFVRQRARNNAAFNNLMSEMFPHARFKQVEKINAKTGETYPGLEITLK